MIVSDYGTLGPLIADSAITKAKFDQLTAQAASGNVSDSYGGYTGSAAQTMFNLQPQIATATALSTNIDAASGRASVTQSVMTQLQSIASSFSASVQTLGSAGGTSVSTVATEARNALQQVASLLNTQDGDVYVFGGTNTATPPIANANSITTSPYFTAIQTAIQGLSTNGAVATLASTMATATATSGVTPFSADTQGYPATAPTVQTSTAGATSTVGLLANQNTLITPMTGASTTGSYMRDLMRSLATIGSLTDVQVSDPGFAAIISDTSASLQGVVGGMANDVSALGVQQFAMTTAKTEVNDTSTALQKQLSSVQQVDLATTASNLQEVQTQLTASYKLIDTIKGMTLADFI